MRKKYHGAIYSNGKTVYEDWYATRRKAVADLKQEARETVLNNFGEDLNVDFTLSRGGMVIANRELPKRKFSRHYAGSVRSVYGLMPVGGTIIC
jgi:hypothetical protein